MLTKSDLQSIKEIVDERLESRLEEKFDKKLKPINRKLNTIEKTVKLIVKNYDEGDVQLHRRLVRVEQRLRISSTE